MPQFEVQKVFAKEHACHILVYVKVHFASLQSFGHNTQIWLLARHKLAKINSTSSRKNSGENWRIRGKWQNGQGIN